MDFGKSCSGCFKFWPFKRRSRSKTKHTWSWSYDRDEEETASVSLDDRNSDGGTMNTFAPCRVERKQGHSRARPSERIVVRPYFGQFAGSWLTFDLRRSESLVSIKVKVEGCDQPLTTLYQRNTPSRPRRNECESSLRDRCLKFVHDVKFSSETIRPSPPKLSFLCEQTVLLHLNELPVSQLPAHYESVFGGQVQDLRIRVWPKSYCPVIRMRVKQHISVRELQWMLCQKLSLRSPLCMNLYQLNSLESLPPNSALQTHHSDLECVLLPGMLHGQKEDETRKSIQIPVSVIGSGIEEVKVHPSMTLCEFEKAVLKQFGLEQTSFLYIPQVFKSRKSSQCGLKMTALLDDSTIALINPTSRTFPVVDGMPSLKVRDSYKHLPLYQTALSELDLLKSCPIIAFEVRGPTIPAAFRTIQTQGNSDDLSASNPRDSVFALVSVRPHAISINPEWTMETMLKYVECISGFPCEHVRVGKTILDRKSTVSEHLLKTWVVVTRSGRLGVCDDIPEVATL